MVRRADLARRANLRVPAAERGRAVRNSADQKSRHLFCVAPNLLHIETATAETLAGFDLWIERFPHCYDICRMIGLDGCVMWIYAYVVFRIRFIRGKTSSATLKLSL
jgi:hypothetical protein